MKWDDEYRHERPAPKESKEEVRAPGSIDQRDGFGMCAAPGEKPQSATPRTDAERARVQEFSDYWKTSLVPADFARQLERELAQAIERGRLANMRADQAEEARDAAVSAIPASAIKVLQYVSRGRDYVDIEPYPDAAAREALGEIRAVDSCTVSTRKEAK